MYIKILEMILFIVIVVCDLNILLFSLFKVFYIMFFINKKFGEWGILIVELILFVNFVFLFYINRIKEESCLFCF